MTTVGYAALQVIPSVKGMGRNLEAALGGPMGKAGRKSGGILGGGLVKSIGKYGTLAGGILTGFMTAKVLKGGFTRQLGIENAEAALQGIGKSAKQATAIVKGPVLDAVRGTAFGIADAANAAAGAMGAGVKGGKELTKYLSLTGDAATVAGIGFNQMSQMMNKVKGTGKLTGGVMTQMAQNGLYVLPMLAKEYGVTQAEMTKMVSKGKVDAEAFQRILTKNIGGAALKSGDTTKGAFANMGAAAGRLGATLTGGLFPHLKDWFNQIGKTLDAVGTAIGPVAEKIGNAFGGKVTSGLTSLSDKLTAFLGKLGEGGGLSDFGKQFSSLLPILSPLGSILKGMGPTLETVGGSFADIGKALGGALAAVLPSVADAFTIIAGAVAGSLESVLPSLVPVIEQIADAFVALAPTLGDVVVQLAESLAPVLPPLATALGDLATAVGTTLAEALPSVTPLLTTFADLVAGMAPELGPLVLMVSDLATKVLDLASPILESEDAVAALVLGIVGWKTAQAGLSFVALIGGVYSSTSAWIANTAAMLANKVETVAIAALYAGDFIKNIASSILSVGRSTAAWVANTAAMLANKVAAAGGWLLGVIASLGSAALAAGTATAAWIANTASVVANKAAQIAAAAATGVVKAGIVAWTAAQWLLNAALNANPIGIVVVAIGLLVGAFVLAWKKSETFRNIVMGAWNGIKAATSKVWGWITGYFKAVFGVYKAIFTGAFKVIRTVVTGVWNGIKAVTSSVWNAIKGAVSGVANGIKSTVSSVFNSVKSTVTGVWNAVKSGTTAAWNGIKTAVSSAIDGVMGFVTGMKDKITGAFSSAGTWLLDSGRKIIGGLIDGIKNMASSVTDAVGGVLKKARDLLPFSPAKKGPFSGRGWTLYSGQSIMTALAQGIRQKGKTAVDALGLALGGLRDRMKSSIDAAVKKQSDHLIAARKKANARIAAHNKAAAKKRDAALAAADKITNSKARAAAKRAAQATYKRSKKDSLGALSRADADKQAKKGLAKQIARQKKADKIVAAQRKKTAKLWANGSSAAVAKLAGELDKNGKLVKKAQKVQGATLADYAKARDVLVNRLSAAKDKLADAVKMRDDFKASVVDSVRSFTSLLGAQAKENALGYDSVLTATDITSHMRERLAAARAFESDMAKLLKAGLNKQTYEELIAQGPEAAGAYAAALVAGGSSAVKEVNSLNSQINATANSFGSTASKNLYQAGVDTAQGLVKGIESQIAAVDKASETIANSVVKAVKKALGIKSPSRVLALMGRFTTQGFGRGVGDAATVRRAVGKATKVAAQVADAFDTTVTPTLATPTLSSPRLTAGGTGGAQVRTFSDADLRALAAIFTDSLESLPDPTLVVNGRQAGVLYREGKKSDGRLG